MMLLSFGFLIIIGIIFSSGYIMCSNISFIRKTTIMCLLINIGLIGAIVLSSLVSIKTALSVSITLVPIMLIIDWYMLKEIEKLQKEKDKAYDEFRKAYDQKCKEYDEKLLELLPYQDKCIKITDDIIYCVPQYIKVREIFKHGDKIVIRGYGFAGEFTEYADATWFDWDYMTSYDFEIYQIEDKVKCIEIIGESEFTNAFNELLNKMRFNHLNTMI